MLKSNEAIQNDKGQDSPSQMFVSCLLLRLKRSIYSNRTLAFTNTIQLYN